jgi:aminoglycoside phosphotransferase (APT) family kinase protein
MRLVHGDFDETHIFADPATGELTQIIDWGDRSAADPAWELGVFLLWDGPRALTQLMAG